VTSASGRVEDGEKEREEKGERKRVGEIRKEFLNTV